MRIHWLFIGWLGEKFVHMVTEGMQLVEMICLKPFVLRAFNGTIQGQQGLLIVFVASVALRILN